MRCSFSFQKGQYAKALEYLNKAFEYPVGLYGRTVYARLYYLAGIIYQKKGNAELAADNFRKATEVVSERRSDNECTFYKSMALKALGKEEESNWLLQSMLDDMNQSGPAFFTQFEGGSRIKDKQLSNDHYYAGLAYMGMGEKVKAAAEFSKSLEFNPAHIWSRVYQSQLK